MALWETGATDSGAIFIFSVQKLALKVGYASMRKECVGIWE